MHCSSHKRLHEDQQRLNAIRQRHRARRTPLMPVEPMDKRPKSEELDGAVSYCSTGVGGVQREVADNHTKLQAAAENGAAGPDAAIHGSAKAKARASHFAASVKALRVFAALGKRLRRIHILLQDDDCAPIIAYRWDGWCFFAVFCIFNIAAALLLALPQVLPRYRVSWQDFRLN